MTHCGVLEARNDVLGQEYAAIKSDQETQMLDQIPHVMTHRWI